MCPDAEPGADLPPVPAGSSIVRLPYDEDAVPAIARELGQPAEVAPFRPGPDPVHRLLIPIGDGPVVPGRPVPAARDDSGRAVATLTLWTAIGRVDVTGAAAAVVATGVVAVDLVRGVEVIFRHRGGSVTVAGNGRIMVRTGSVLGAHNDVTNWSDRR